jgi:hypothetical protein
MKKNLLHHYPAVPAQQADPEREKKQLTHYRGMFFKLARKAGGQGWQ